MSPRLPLRSSEVSKNQSNHWHSLFGRLQSLRNFPKLATSRFYMLLSTKEKRGQQMDQNGQNVKKKRINNHVPCTFPSSKQSSRENTWKLCLRLDWNGPRLSHWHCKLCCKRMARLMQSNEKTSFIIFPDILPLESRVCLFQKTIGLEVEKTMIPQSTHKFTKQFFHAIWRVSAPFHRAISRTLSLR